ncbi:tellurite resistance TerB family protein [Roseovarius aestuarii]|uniref:Tellurite resistance protein TerB n=1 Tax=Roseovarius aestuarii TaxID=475083 RepID=A0A1X7BV48_9RHOB|nr:TerB family tellurite resistance protein [Roseovarius aestuarii]SMC13365.1 Tellurite resistance protein TerB [Roseovarius aestuarii]
MFSSLLKHLIQPEPKRLSEVDARVALSALLVRVARSDGDYATEEKDRIDRIIADRYSLSPFEATALRGRAEALENEAPDTVVFTEAIKQAVDYDHRLAVVEALWKVALADGERDAQEDALLRLVSKFLGVSDMDSARARQRVAGTG